MTAPRLDKIDFFPPAERVLTPQEWDTAHSIVAIDPLKERTPLDRVGLPMRPLSPGEWDQAKMMNPTAIAKWKAPALAPRDVTTTAIDRAKDKKGAKIDGIGGEILKQLVDPALENPIATTAMGIGTAIPGVNAVLGAAIGGQMVHHIAQYGWQKAAELSLPDDVRKIAEHDPDRISGEAAAVQAALLGLAPLVHVGIKNYKGLNALGEGMFSGAREAHQTAGIDFEPGFNDAHKTADFAASLDGQGERTALNQRFGMQADRPKGFVPTANTSRAGAGAAPVEGMVVPETVKAGKVAPVETVDPAAPLEERAAIDASRREYEAQRTEQDLADLRAADAEKVRMAIRRRPQGAKVPFFESDQGAQTLGAAAARHGMPDDANPYHPESPLAQSWSEGHSAATESYPEGFSMGGALRDNRIPSDYQVPKVPGFEPHVVPEGVTPETIALADALKPSRFRGHSESDLIAAAVDAQERVEAAQEAAARTGEGEAGFTEHLKGDNTFADQAVGGNPFYAKTVERELVRAKSALSQIEREAALRGLTGDQLAERIAAEKETRAERQAMQEEESLSGFMGADDPFAEKLAPASAGLTPIEGTGELKTRGLSVSVERKAIANRLDVGFGDLPEYRTMKVADQAEMAASLLERETELARRIALGEAVPTGDLQPEAVFVAVENRAIAEGDVGTLRDLASSKLTGEATTMGQRIRLLGERDADSPVAAIQKVIDVRSKGVKDVPKATEEVVASLRAKLADVKVTVEQWQAFVDSLRCS